MGFIPKTARDLFFFLVNVSMMLIATVVVVFFYWIIYDNNFNPPGVSTPYEYPRFVPMGGTFEATYIVERFRDCQLRVDRDIVNEITGDSFQTTYNQTNRYMEGSTFRSISIDLPELLDPGLYSYNVAINYFCNPSNRIFGPIVIHPDRVVFEIVDGLREPEWVRLNVDPAVVARSEAEATPSQ